MASARRWGHSVWAWRLLAVGAILAVLLLLFSVTVQGRIFSVMLLVWEAGTALALFLGWARSERHRLDAEGVGDGLHDLL
jgi:hypothetical protein